jgi:hypothetical protein
MGSGTATSLYEGSGSGLLKSTLDAAHRGTLMQVSSAAAYRGKSVKMRAFLRSDEVAQRAGLWIRADDINGTTVAFRNCFSPRAPQSFVSGNTAWREVEISIDIPESAIALSYGAQMIGTGTVWMSWVLMLKGILSKPSRPSIRLPIRRNCLQRHRIGISRNEPRSGRWRRSARGPRVRIGGEPPGDGHRRAAALLTFTGYNLVRMRNLLAPDFK